MSKGVAHTCEPKAGTFKPPTRPSWKRPAGMVLRKAYCSWEQQAQREHERKESWRKHERRSCRKRNRGQGRGCAPRVAKPKSADPQGWSAECGEAEGGRLRWAAWAEMGSWPGPAAAAPLLTAMLQLLLNPQVAKRREERKGGRRGTRGRTPESWKPLLGGSRWGRTTRARAWPAEPAGADTPREGHVKRRRQGWSPDNHAQPTQVARPDKNWESHCNEHSGSIFFFFFFLGQCGHGRSGCRFLVNVDIGQCGHGRSGLRCIYLWVRGGGNINLLGGGIAVWDDFDKQFLRLWCKCLALSSSTPLFCALNRQRGSTKE